MTSKLIVNSIRHTGASADAITMDASGNVTFPANATCSGTATGFGGGKVLQVLQTVIDAQQTYGTSGENEVMNVSITPSATSSKVLVCVNMANCYTNGSTTEVQFIIYRDSTEITGLARYFGAGGTTPVDGSPNGMFLDSPNSTSSITYRLKVARVAGTDGYIINHTNGQAKSSITVMEIAA